MTLSRQALAILNQKYECPSCGKMAIVKEYYKVPDTDTFSLFSDCCKMIVHQCFLPMDKELKDDPEEVRKEIQEVKILKMVYPASKYTVVCEGYTTYKTNDKQDALAKVAAIYMDQLGHGEDCHLKDECPYQYDGMD